MFVPTDDVRFCPSCGARGAIEVDRGRDDYYLGPIYRCGECREGFYHSEADPAPIRVSGDDTHSPWTELLRESALEVLRPGAAIFLAEIGRTGTKAARIPIIQGQVPPSGDAATTKP